MNFELTSERQMLQDTLRRFLNDHYTPAKRQEILQKDSGYSPEIWADLADLGVIGALFSESDGGFGGQGFDIAVLFEELGRAGVVEPFLDTGILAGGLLCALGAPSQKALVDKVMAGHCHMAFAHSEPNSRYDLQRVETTAEVNGDQIILTGRKAVVVNASVADVLLVSARESGEIDAKAGISVFVVPANTAGVTLQSYPLLAGGMASEVTLDNVQVPTNARLGTAGEAFGAIETQNAAAIVASCAETLGAMETAITLTKEYLMTRKQFGRPIGSFQALAHRFADLLIELEQARSAVILAAGHLSADRAKRERMASAAKNLIGRVGRLVAEETIQMHGGIAMTQEYELSHIAKRIVMADHRFGDTDHHLERFISFSRENTG